MTTTGWRQRLGVQQQTVDTRERLRDCLGALLGLWIAGGVAWWQLGSDAVWLAASMGASAVLLFAVPSSPLAQPWPVLMGNVVSATVGVLVYRLGGATPLTAALAAALALAAMFQLRCVHPPGGGAAISAVLGSPAVHALGFGYALKPVLLNATLLLAVALVYRRLTRPAPAHAPVVHDNRHHTADPAPQDRLGPTAVDLDAVLDHYNQLVDVDRDVLEDLLRQAQEHAWQRRFGRVLCGDIMSRDVVSVTYGTPLDEAWSLLHHHKVAALPVLDPARRVVGIITVADFLRHAQVDPTRHRSLRERVQALIRRSTDLHSSKPEAVGQVMTQGVQTARVDEPVVELVPRLSDLGLHHIPVLDSERRLAGMVSQSDLLAALYRAQAGG
jgi:CBS domain-containing membrane protein